MFVEGARHSGLKAVGMLKESCPGSYALRTEEC